MQTSLTLPLYWPARQLDSLTKQSHLQTHTNIFQNWKTRKPVSTGERTGLIAGYPQNGHPGKRRRWMCFAIERFPNVRQLLIK